jgi:hypothetical protein
MTTISKQFTKYIQQTIKALLIYERVNYCSLGFSFLWNFAAVAQDKTSLTPDGSHQYLVKSNEVSLANTKVAKNMSQAHRKMKDTLM